MPMDKVGANQMRTDDLMDDDRDDITEMTESDRMFEDNMP